MAKSSVAERRVRPNSFYVYVHSRLSSGEPFYVGKGAGQRVYEHRGRSEHWKRIVAKDGGRYITFVARNLNEEFALLLECELIDHYRRFGVKLCNQTDGGDGMSGYRMTPEQRANQSRAQRGHKNNPGRKLSDETKAKLSLLKKSKPGRKQSDEEKQMRREKMLGNKWALGQIVSAETRALLSSQRKGKQFTLGHKLTEEHKAKVVAARMALPKEKRDEIYKKVSASLKAHHERRKAAK